MTVNDDNPYSSPPPSAPIEDAEIIANGTSQRLERLTGICMVIGNIVFIVGILMAGVTQEIYGDRSPSTAIFFSAAALAFVCVFLLPLLVSWFHKPE